MIIKRSRGFNEVPTFNFDKITRTIDIEGNSIPEDAQEVWRDFSRDIKEFIYRYEDVVINFKLDIFNTTSSLYLNNVFSFIQGLDKEHYQVIINWYYLEIDEDNYELGEEYKERFDIKFNLIEIKK
jgi:hypothetical protein